LKQHILFVDDDPNLLQSLQRMLRSMRREWDMHFASCGPEALELLDHTPCDVVVSDMRMPGMDGAQLLAAVRQRHPMTVRFALSGHTDPDMILRAVGPTHQFLAKPCDADVLKTAVSRVCTLRTLLPDTALTRMVTGIETLPSTPALYQQVVAAAASPNGSLDAIAQTITSDLGMTAKMLQLVHSAFFGLQRHLSNPAQVVDLLGLDTIQALVLTAQVFSYADSTTMGGLSLDTLWRHGMAVGSCARHIAQLMGCDKTALDDTFTAGLLHDIGIVILAIHLPEHRGRVKAHAQADPIAYWQAEEAILGASHAEVGAYLMGLWGLPLSIVNALAYHHKPMACPTHTLAPLTAVHVADIMVHTLTANGAQAHHRQLDQAYLDALDLADQIPAWREGCQQTLDALRGQPEPGPKSLSHA
jgi:HD-like signal output (HDOD) protein